MTMGHVSDSIVGISNVLYQSNDVPVNTDKPGVCLSNAIYEGKLFLMHNSYESLILVMHATIIVYSPAFKWNIFNVI